MKRRARSATFIRASVTAGTRSVSTGPRNFSVRWKLSGPTQVTSFATGRNCSTEAASARRTSSGSRIATKARTGVVRRPNPRACGAACRAPSATTATHRRPAAREPELSRLDAPATATPMNTVPTGLVGVPPSGPAMPVMLRPHAAPERWQAPRTIASAHGRLTAPCTRSTSAGTPSSSSLARLDARPCRARRMRRSRRCWSVGGRRGPRYRTPPAPASSRAPRAGGPPPARGSRRRGRSESCPSVSAMRSSSAASVCAAASALAPRARSRTDTSPSTVAIDTVASLPLSPGASQAARRSSMSAGDTPAVRSVRIATAAPRPARPRTKSVSSAVVAGVSPPRQHDPGRGLGVEHPAGLAVGRGPHGGALGQQREPFVATGQRTVATPVKILERGQHLVVEHQAGAGGAGQDAAGDVAGARDDDRQRCGRRQRALQCGLVFVHDGAALEAHTRGGERRGDRGGVVVDGRGGRPSTTSRMPGVTAIPGVGRRAGGSAR